MKDQLWPILVVIMSLVISWAFGFTVIADSVIPGDFEPDNDVDWADFAVLSAAWQTHSSEVGGNLVGYWKMEDDANNLTVLDSSGNNNHGAAHQNTSEISITGMIDGALSFNGIDDYIQVADSEALSPTQEVTVCGWFWFNDASENVGLIWKHNYNYALWTVSDTVRFAVWNSSSEGSTATFSTSLLEAGWNFIAGVFDGTNSALYLNGAEAGTPGASITGPIRDRAGDLYIGRWPGIGDEYFDGLIDGVRIFSTALSATDIQALYNEVGWNHLCDISDPNDGVIDMLDVLVFSRHWLANAPLGMVFIEGGEYEMGDHYNVGSPAEEPNHLVCIDSFCMDTYEVTNQQFCAFLNSALSENLIEVRTGPIVYGLDANEPYCDTHEHDSESRILWDGNTFSVAGGKEDHPMVRVSWFGAVGYCNWCSAQESRPICYDLATSTCNFAAYGYRLPTEAEWEYAGRGGLEYYMYPWGNDADYSKANWFNSGDPYESGSYPYTTPVGYYQANGYGLYDMAGNVWEWCNDWYNMDYYSWSPYNNPRGPASDFRRVFRGGCLQYDYLISRTAHRGYATPKTTRSYGGFRTVVSF